MPMVDASAESLILDQAPWAQTTTDAARPVLSAIGGAMITVTGVVFSITVVALSIASSQFGSRMLRNFMDDRTTQVTIGMLVGTSLYCFLIMRTVREIQGTSFVPHLSVLLSVVMVLISMGALILFIHHMALSIQAPQILASLGADLDDSIERLFPEKIGSPAEDSHQEIDEATKRVVLGSNFAPLLAEHEGYLQAIDSNGLIALAKEHDLVIELGKRPGDFVLKNTAVAKIWPATRLSDEVSEELNDTLIYGTRRTPRQDVLCTVEEIVEVAVRALSPGINAPLTAVTCIDRLGASLSRLAGRKIPSASRYDHDGKLRLIAPPTTFPDVLRASFDEIRHYGRESVAVLLRLLTTLQVLSQFVERGEDRQAILQHASMIIDASTLAHHQESDRKLFQNEYDQLLRIFDRDEPLHAMEERGGCLVSIALGFIGALLGTWLARRFDLPMLFTLQVGDEPFPILWSIIGAALFAAVLALLSGGLIVMILTWIAARLATKIAARLLKRTRLRTSLKDLFRHFVQIGIWVLGLTVAAVIVFPNMTPAKVLAALGLGSVAIGFAFKDIFENFFAGVLILWRFPFDPGDFIECNGIEGKVEDVTIRMTKIRRLDGELTVVPNSMLFKQPVDILTSWKRRRVTVICGVAYGEDVDEARSVIRQAVESCKTIDSGQDVEIFAQAFGASSIDFEVTWWTGPTPLEVRKSRDEVVASVKRALDDANIEIPFPYRTLTFKEPLQTVSQANGESMAQDEPTKSTPPQTPDNASIDGEAVVTGKVDVQPLARDEEIEARLSQILKSTEWFSNATVDAENGVVFIQGETSQQQYKEWATKLAQQTQDVVAVVNRVDVVSGPIWNFTPAYTQLHTLWRSTIQSLPLVVVGIVILFLTFLATRLSSRLARSILSRQIENQLLRDVAAKAIAIPVFLVGLYIVLHVAGLTRLALTVLGGTGLAGLIIGIAFRDIAENFLASLLISVQNPFRTGDLIKVNEHLGIVQKVTTRGTLLMAYDGTYIQIPNSIVYKNIILNYTANSSTRLDFAIGIGYDVAIAKAQEVAQSALLRHPTVLNDPEPMVLVESLGAATVNIRVYFWINSQEHSPPRVISSAIRLVKRAFVKENISLPDEAREVVFPNGVPIQTMDMEAAKKDTTESSSRETFFEEEPDEVSTPAEGNLRSEKQDVEAQAETAREPEEGAAFSTVAKSLVNDLLMPPIGLALGGVDFSDLFITLKSGPENEGPYRSLADATAAGAVTLNYGQFANSVLSLLIVALAMFILIRIFMRIEQAFDQEETSDSTPLAGANFQSDNGLQLAASVSYYAALSFFPLLLILISGLGYVLRSTGWGQDAQRQLLEFVSDQASPSLADRVGTTLNEVQANAALNGPIGLISLLVTAVMIFAQFENAFDQIWNVDRSGKKGIVSKAKQVVWYRMRAFLMLLGAGALVMVTFFAGIAVTGASSLGDEFLHLPRTFWTALQLVVTLALNWGMFTLIYRILPKVPVRWSEAARGGLLASITWEIGRQILAALVIGNKYNAYGVVGAFIAIMLWVYYAMAVIFFCAEYVQVICNSYESGDAETEGNAA
ncbi:unnamed protein product [Cladocopium goreaui]|uniref:Uncharacterized protein Mb1321c n=1 Tax=Cladocopium goreaui TaxID=2562237 RepID=A0A9P1BFZ6_9DINO|nr:unnamed protein product [Cladocopium goreaui]